MGLCSERVGEENNDIYVAYFYDKIDSIATDITGQFYSLDDNCTYTYQWYDPRENVYLDEVTITSQNGTFTIPKRPTREDWVILLKKK